MRKLKAGKRYVQRDGRITRALVEHTDKDYPFAEQYHGTYQNMWGERGISVISPETDLVARYKAPYNLRLMITNQLRKLFLFHSCQTEVRRRNRVEKPRTLKDGRTAFSVWYRCDGCTELFKSNEVQVDHIEPVVDVNAGFVGWDSYISRMFCDPSGMRLVCKPCHKAKTKIERDQRTIANRLRKMETE